MTRHESRLSALGQGMANFMGVNYIPPWAQEAREAAIQEEAEQDRLLVEGGVTRTSGPLSSLASGSVERGGSRVSRSRSQTWFNPTERGHFCFPPRAYPQPEKSADTPIGEGSCWRCRCGAEWEAHGSMVLGEDPVGVQRNDYTLGVERWVYLGKGIDGVDYARHQNSMYDFRPLGPYYVRLLRIIADTVRWGSGAENWRDADD